MAYGFYVANTETVYAENVSPYTGVPGTVRERTFIAVKPDGVQRGLVGEVIRRFEAKGYKLVAIKLVHPTQSFAEQVSCSFFFFLLNNLDFQLTLYFLSALQGSRQEAFLPWSCEVLLVGPRCWYYTRTSLAFSHY